MYRKGKVGGGGAEGYSAIAKLELQIEPELLGYSYSCKVGGAESYSAIATQRRREAHLQDVSRPVQEVIDRHQNFLGGPREEVEALFRDLEGSDGREVAALQLDVAAQPLRRKGGKGVSTTGLCEEGG
jgi:hypothetical protein